MIIITLFVLVFRFQQSGHKLLKLPDKIPVNVKRGRKRKVALALQRENEDIIFEDDPSNNILENYNGKKFMISRNL